MHEVPSYYWINLALLLLTLKMSLSAGYMPWDSWFKIIRCFFVYRTEFRCIAFQMQVLHGTQTISWSDISQENVHGWAEF